jgi:hypothetical protein
VLSIVDSLPPILQVYIALAALHYNEDSKKSVAKTKDEQIDYCIKIPKFKKLGGYTVHEVRDNSTFISPFPNQHLIAIFMLHYCL